jgi:hypothetical protein
MLLLLPLPLLLLLLTLLLLPVLLLQNAAHHLMGLLHERLHSHNLIISTEQPTCAFSYKQLLSLL